MSLLAVPIAALTLALAPAAEAPARVAFTSGDAIWTVRPDGSDRRKLTAGREPAFSPDGARLAFVRDRSLMVGAADGSGTKTLIGLVDTNLGTPRFSPDGRQIAYAVTGVGPEGLRSSIEVVPSDGTGGARAVVRHLDENGRDAVSAPVWSPAGDLLAYTRVTHTDDRVARSDMRSVRLDGGDDRVFLADAGLGAWSPDGTRFAFSDTSGTAGARCREGDCLPRGDLAITDPTGAARTRLLRTASHESDPAWSSDGSRIAFASGRNTPELRFEQPEIYTVAADGSCLTWLTNGVPASTGPAWQPGAGPADAGGCGALGREPLTQVTPSRSARGLLWLGPRFGNALATTVTGTRRSGFADYGDCAAFQPADCPPLFLLVQGDACKDERSLRRLIRRLGRARRVGRAIVSGRRGVILAGRSTVEVHVLSSASASRKAALHEEIARSLRRVGGGAPGAVRLPARLRRRMPANVRRIVKAC